MKLEEIYQTIINNTKLAHSLIVFIFIIVLIGYIKRWNWVTETIGNRKTTRLLELFGFENYRKIMIGILIMGILAVMSLIIIS